MCEKVEERVELHDAHSFVLLAPAPSLRNRCRTLCPEKAAILLDRFAPGGKGSGFGVRGRAVVLRLSARTSTEQGRGATFVDG